MDNKPTFNEYIFHNKYDIVSCKDGRHYLITNPKSRIFDVALYISLYVLLFIAIPHCLSLSVHLIGEDCWALLFLLYFCLIRIQYRFTRFEDISHDEDYQDELKPYKRRGEYILKVLFAIIFIFLILNSYSFTYLISRIDDNTRLTETKFTMGNSSAVHLETKESVDYSKLNEIILPTNDETNYDISMLAIVVGSPELARISVDDKLLIKDVSRYIYKFDFWEPDYFKQEYFIKTKVHDGSVLELDCGSLHREWTFRCQTE